VVQCAVDMIPSLGPAEESGKAAGETEEVVERLTYLKERRKTVRRLRYIVAVTELNLG
jgi:hypothetical protein